MIKAIETIYNGYRFRSRLEARWAVFFDTLGIKYEYEKEGFDLDGIWYLPDFYISSWKAFVEIKPWPPSEQGDEVQKCLKLSELNSSKVLLLNGEPWLNEYQIAIYTEGKLAWCFMHFAWCRKCDKELYVSGEDWGYTTLNNNPDCHSERWPIEDHPRLIAAYTAARQARFEHGETPSHKTDAQPEVKQRANKSRKKNTKKPPAERKAQITLVAGDRIFHTLFGEGLVLSSRYEYVEIKFNDGLISTFSLEYAPLKKIEDEVPL